MSKLRYILIFVTVVEGLITFRAVMYDPEKLPIFLVWSCIILSLILVISFSLYYILVEQKQDWRIDLVYCFLLYFCLVVGFAGAYYLKKREFKITTGGDFILENLEKEKQALKKQIPMFNEDAEREYDRWNKLEDKKRAIFLLIGQILNRRITEEKKIFQFIPDDPEPLYKEHEVLEERQKQLNNDLISYHKNYLAAKFLADEADARIRRYSYFDFLYFSIVTITTVGYGDITPYTRMAKIMVTLEILLGSALILIYLTLVINRAWKKP